MAWFARDVAAQRLIHHDSRSRRSLRPFHDDLASKDRHYGPAFKLLSFPYGPSGRAVNHISSDLHSPLKIDHHKIGVRSHADRSFFRINAENPSGILATNLYQLLQ